MTDAMKAALAAEIDKVEAWLAYEDADELKYMYTTDDAQIQIDGMLECMDPDDLFPEGLRDPATMLIVWNYCVELQKRWAAERKEERERPDREYLLRSVCDGIKQSSIKTAREIADIYEMDQLADIYSSLEVFDLDTLQKVSLLDLVEPILKNKRWMEQEYRDYCDSERY